MKVHELAKKLGVSSKDLIAELKKLKVKVSSHMSAIDDKTVEIIEQKLGGDKKEVKAKKPKAKEKQPKKTEEKKEKTPKKKAKPSKATEEKKAEAVEVEVIEEEAEEIEEVEEKEKPAEVEEIDEEAAEEKIEEKAREEKKVEVKEIKSIQLNMPITVGSLATNLNLKPTEVIKALIEKGIFANVNQLLNEKIVHEIAYQFGYKVEKLPSEEEKILKVEEEENPKDLVLRPPVATLMGHVDHGKTTLLDAIRKSNLVDREAGRITQHIGAYGVDIPGKGHVTFLDTPGHEAFTAMRARGANITDVVVLVVAADDGVMPQTVEAIDHAKAAGVPIVVAINKSDLPAANPNKVKGELQKLELTPEEWGGKTICVSVSAKTQQGIENLLEMLLLEAEVLELKSNPNRPAQGTVIEGKLTKSHGAVATILVQKGTLRVGDALVCGIHHGKVKAMHNDKGKTVKEAGPSYAVEILGLSGVPEAGDTFYVCEDERAARKISETKALELREKEMSGTLRKHLTLEGLHDRITGGELKELKIVLKADVQGSIEALSKSLQKLSTPKITLSIIHSATGGINESDIMLAAASDAIIIGFHVKPDQKAENLREKEGVDVRYYNIIYQVVDEIKKAMEGLLEPTLKEAVQGKAEIRQVFKSSKFGTIGGGYVFKGRIARNHKVRLIRNNIIIYDGRLSSLKRFKEDAREVSEGHECGVLLENYNDLKVGDIIEAYKVEKIAAKL